MNVRLYLDEDVSPALARLLRTAGYDAVSVHEVGAMTRSDDDQFDRAISESRTILTFNYRHFNAIAKRASATGRNHPGIIISYQQYDRNEISTLRDALVSFLGAHTAEDLANTLMVLPRPATP